LYTNEFYRENSRRALNPSHYQVVESTIQKYNIVIEGLADVERDFESALIDVSTTKHGVGEDLSIPQDSNTALGSIHRDILSDALYELSDMIELDSMNVFSGSSSLRDAKVGILGQMTPKRNRNETLTALSKSFDYLIRAAALGHKKAQHRLATAYATGIYGTALVPMDAGRSLSLEYMAGQ
jgi:hypothetical protein